MRQQIQQGGVFDFLTKEELQAELGHKLDQTIRDWARGVKLIRFRTNAVTDASGNFTAQIPGPESGYVWDIKRVTVAGPAYFAGVNSASAEGTATAPTAGATIVQVPLGVGTFKIDWTVGIDGTATAVTDRNNFQLFQSGTGANFGVDTSVNLDQVGVYPQQSAIVTSTNSNNFIKVLAVANAGAAAVYSAQVTATQIATDATNTALYRAGSSADADPGHFVSFIESATSTTADFGGIATTFPKLSVTYVGGENLVIVGQGLVTASAATISGQAVEVPAEMIAKLL
jgi:hypothetical protein